MGLVALLAIGGAMTWVKGASAAAGETGDPAGRAPTSFALPAPMPAPALRLPDNDGKPVAPGKDAKARQPVFLRLKQPDGKIFRETQLQPGEQGYFNFEQLIPADAPT